ncbi:MAG: histidine kinase N-terminal 7TM domain-containing protein [Methanobacterium sp.]
MNDQYILYTAGFFVTFLISFSLALYAFRKRSIQLHNFFILAMLSISIWSFGSLMEFISPDINTKIFWAKFSYIGITTVSPFLFLFVLSYGKYNKYIKLPYIILLMIIPLIVLLLAFFNEWTHLIWANIIPVTTSYGLVLVYEHGAAFWMQLIYSYLLLFSAMILLINMFIQSPRIYKLQVGAALIGIASPLIFNFIYVTGLSQGLVDLTPLAFAITSIFAALGVFRFHLLNILPVAYYELFKNMTNGFIIFDENDRLLEINLTAQKMFQITSDSIGNKFDDIFIKFDNLKSYYKESKQNNSELLLNNRWYNLQKTPLYDKENILYGHLIIITDIDKRKKSEEALKENQRALNTLISNLPGVAYRCQNDPQWTMEFVSEGCYELTGYKPTDLIMNKKISYNDLIHPDDREKVYDSVQEALKYEKPFELVYRINTNDSIEKYVWEQGRGVYSPDGNVISLEGFITDITEGVISEKELKKSLNEKNILLKEIHHRVKNNMQIISSLLSLQANHVNNNETLDTLKESRDRIRAMALVHEKLYQSKDLSEINFSDYIKSLLTEIQGSYKLNTQIETEINIEDIYLDIEKAIPCGLIINELISNIFKHAFKDREKGHIILNFSKKHDLYELVVQDDGIGIPHDINMNNNNTLGLKLVDALVNQLHGTVEVNRNNGTQFVIKF